MKREEVMQGSWSVAVDEKRPYLAVDDAVLVGAPAWCCGAMAVGGSEEDFRRQTAGSGDKSCCRGRGGRRSGNGKVEDNADEARGGDERILVQRRG